MRYILSMENGFCYWDTETETGRYLGNNSSAFDLDKEKDMKLVKRILECGEAIKSYYSEPDKKSLKVVETISGIFFYHLSETGENGKPTLCGRKDVMLTNLPISSWGIKTHLKERYCHACEYKSKR